MDEFLVEYKYKVTEAKKSHLCIQSFITTGKINEYINEMRPS